MLYSPVLLSLSPSSKAAHPWFLFSILFHVTCFKLKLMWIIKCFLKESFHTAPLSLFKVNYWCSDKLKRLRIIIFSPSFRTQEISSDNGCLFRIIQRKHKGETLKVVLEESCSNHCIIQDVNVVYISQKIERKLGCNLWSPGLTTRQRQLQKTLIRF